MGRGLSHPRRLNNPARAASPGQAQALGEDQIRAFAAQAQEPGPPAAQALGGQNQPRKNPYLRPDHQSPRNLPRREPGPS